MRRQFLIQALVRTLDGPEALVETLSDLNRVNTCLMCVWRTSPVIWPR